jgi:hypothetical protein
MNWLGGVAVSEMSFSPGMLEPWIDKVASKPYKNRLQVNREIPRSIHGQK